MAVVEKLSLHWRILATFLSFHNRSKRLLSHSLKHHFETVPNSNKLQTTTAMWLLHNFKDTNCIESIVEKGEIAHFEQFHLFPQYFPKAFFVNVFK